MEPKLIRPALETDIARVIDMTERLVAAVDGPQRPCRVKTGETLTALRHTPDGAVFVSDAGFIAACIGETIISRERVAYELGWWSEDKMGLRLLRNFEEWGADRRATLLKVSCKGGAAQRILEQSGYRVAEVQMTRRI